MAIAAGGDQHAQSDEVSPSLHVVPGVVEAAPLDPDRGLLSQAAYRAIRAQVSTVPPVRDLLWVFLAGGAGATLRVALVPLLDKRLHQVLPFAGTLVVNMLGCLAIGTLSVVLAPGSARPIVLGGLLGGFTTYSAFGLLSWDLLDEGRRGAFAGQILLHVLGGLACVWLGLVVGRALAPESRL
jgi:CrcB protein